MLLTVWTLAWACVILHVLNTENNVSPKIHLIYFYLKSSSLSQLLNTFLDTDIKFNRFILYRHIVDKIREVPADVGVLLMFYNKTSESLSRRLITSSRLYALHICQSLVSKR